MGPVLEVFEFDFTESEVKLSGQTDLHFEAAEDGVLNCICFWYRMNLTENVAIDHTPLKFRATDEDPIVGDYQRHAQQWLASPVPVSKGDKIHIRASYSRSRIRFEVMSPEVPKIDRTIACPRWMYLRFHDEQRTEAFKKAIEKAVDKIMAAREEIEKLDRKPLRVVHLGAGLGQISMVAAKALRDAGVTEADIEEYGYQVIAFEQMPKATKLAHKIFKDNGLHNDIYFCAEDCRKLPSQPTRAQLIISELIDPGLLGEGILPLLSAARIKTCDSFDHQVIPSRARIWAAGFEFGEQATV